MEEWCRQMRTFPGLALDGRKTELGGKKNPWKQVNLWGIWGYQKHIKKHRRGRSVDQS